MSLIASPLTNREVEILTLARDGLTGKEIAATAGITESTVSTHLSMIKGKLSAANTANAVVIAIRCGFINLKGQVKND